MDIFDFVSWILVIIVAVTLSWPLTIPLAALAYKVRLGSQAVPLAPNEFWIRSTFASLALALLSVLLVGLNYVAVESADLHEARGGIQLVLLMAYIPAGVFFLFWIYAMEDLLEALGVFLVYILLPGLLLLLIGWLFKLGPKLADRAPWLVSISS